MRNRISIAIFLSCFFVLFSVASTVEAVGIFGPPNPTARPGSFSVGGGYFTSDNRWDGKILEHLCVDQEHYFIQGTYAFNKRWEALVRIGTADARLADHYYYKDSDKWFAALGVNGLFAGTEKLGAGISIQGSGYGKYRSSQNMVEAGTPVRQTVEWQQYDLTGALTGQAKLWRLTFYGGPFLYLAWADAQLRRSGPSGTTKQTATAREDNMLGVAIGVRLALSDCFTITGEWQSRSGYSKGIMLSYAF